MTVETILRRKGTGVATIEPDASIRRAAGLAARKEHRRSRGNQQEGSSWSHFRNPKMALVSEGWETPQRLAARVKLRSSQSARK